jgi:hypothetical protein
MSNSAEQPGVPGLFENSLRLLRDKSSRRPAEETWLADLTRIQSQCRANRPAQAYADRLAQTGRHTDIPFVTLACSQGVDQPFEWRKLAVYKTVWDLAIYQMLMSALQPRTVIELGSGSGGSAVWLADMGVAAGADCQVHTFDITPPNVAHERFEVATWLTDFYGINATCACNSIWVCTGSR